MFKGLGNIASLLGNAQHLSEKVAQITETLKVKRVTGQSGAGMVVVEMNGLGQVVSVKIDVTLVEQSDHEMIQDLLPAAINQATNKAKQMHLEAMQSMTGGIPLPGLNQALDQWIGGVSTVADESPEPPEAPAPPAPDAHPSDSDPGDESGPPV